MLQRVSSLLLLYTPYITLVNELPPSAIILHT